jgi:Flp pilus assembly protein TadG
VRLLSRAPGRHPERGGAVVEFTLVLPILMAVTVGAIDLGRVLVSKEMSVYATAVGARLAVGKVNSSGATLSSTDVQNAVIAAAPLLKLTTSNVTVAVSGSTTTFTSRTRGDKVTVSITGCTFTSVSKVSKLATGKNCNSTSVMVIP